MKIPGEPTGDDYALIADRLATPGEGPPDKDAKEKAKAILDDPKHDRPKGSPDDEATRDDAVPEGE